MLKQYASREKCQYCGLVQLYVVAFVDNEWTIWLGCPPCYTDCIEAGPFVTEQDAITHIKENLQ